MSLLLGRRWAVPTLRSGFYFSAILKRIRRADDQIFAADQAFADLHFAAAGVFDDRDGSLDRFSIFHDEHSAITDSAGGDANVGTLHSGIGRLCRGGSAH